MVATVTVGGNPFGVAVTPDGNTRLVGESLTGRFGYRHGHQHGSGHGRGGGGGPTPRRRPDGKHAYVTGPTGNVSVIDTATNTVVATVVLEPGHQHGVAVTPDGIYVYVTRFQLGGGVSVIATATNTVVGTPRWFRDWK